LLLDGAHNPQAARALRDYLKEFLPGRRIVLLTAMMRDKQPEACADVLAPLAAEVVAAQVEGPRAKPAEELARVYRARGVPAVSAPDPGAALEAARRLAGVEGVVVACGSLYLVGELMKRTGRERDPPPDSHRIRR
jgi:dihydrofolate synthase/folylpolyglutamate synthase